MENQQQKQQELLRKFEEMEMFVKNHLSKEALTRFCAVKAVHPDIALQAVVTLSQFLNKSKLQHVDDQTLKSILREIQFQKKEYNFVEK